ncbi:MAG: PAS domain-containing protein [Bacteroidia bacterium]
MKQGNTSENDLIEKSDRAFFALNAVNIGIWDFDPINNHLYLDDCCKKLYNYTTELPDTFESLLNFVHLDDRKKVSEAFSEALSEATKGALNVKFRILESPEKKACWLHSTGKVYFNEQQKAQRFSGIVQDITVEVKKLQALKANLAMFKNVTDSSTTGLWLTDENEEVIYVNKILLEWTRLPNQGFYGDGWINSIIEEDRQRCMDVFFNAVSNRQSYEILMRMKRGDDKIVWYRSGGGPYYEGDQYAGYAGFCVDVDELMLSREALEKNEAKLQSVIASAPVAICLLTGIDLVIEMPNQNFVDILGKGPDIAGKSLRNVISEDESQPFIKILEEVYTSGKIFKIQSTPINTLNTLQNGANIINYYDIAFTPLFDNQGEVFAILDISIDVTESVKAKQKIEQAELALRDAIELAELGTWNIDGKTGLISFSDRIKYWFAADGNFSNEKVFDSIHERDRDRVYKAIAYAMTNESGGVYDEEYIVVDRYSRKERILHSLGRTLFDETGKPIKMVGTAQDVTKQRHLQYSLETEVRERTEELAMANDNLQASNEELLVTNEELAETNLELINTNEELERYAYIASHDLQEPLRKIRIFSDILSSKVGLPSEEILLVNKINHSAKRMSSLIEGLLEISRLLKEDIKKCPVDLSKIAAEVIFDFELLIEEKKAIVSIDKLPIIEAVELQMNQLFYNLLSNALKFTTSKRSPVINITVKKIIKFESKNFTIIPIVGVNYYHISFIDNGIGFDEKYIEHVFEIFKKLNPTNTYEGSGIGLSICKRIVSNLNGYIYVETKRDNGSTFHVILPDKS